MVIETDRNTGIIFRPNTFDSWILNESASYFKNGAMGLRPDDVVLDLGGHIGTFASRAKMECADCKIISVEAQKDNYAVLKRNAAKFDFTAIHAAAVHSDLDGTKVTMYVNAKKNNALHSSVPVRGRGTEITDGYGLRQLFYEANRLFSSSVTVVKVDIEAQEYELDWEVLPASVRKVVMELHLLGKTNSGQSRREITPAFIRRFAALGFQTDSLSKITDKNWTAMAKLSRPV